MNNLNSILIEGNIVRDPQFRSTPKGTPVCTFSVASNRFYKQDSGFEKEVSFLPRTKGTPSPRSTPSSAHGP